MLIYDEKLHLEVETSLLEMLKIILAGLENKMCYWTLDKYH